MIGCIGADLLQAHASRYPAKLTISKCVFSGECDGFYMFVYLHRIVWGSFSFLDFAVTAFFAKISHRYVDGLSSFATFGKRPISSLIPDRKISETTDMTYSTGERISNVAPHYGSIKGW